MLSFSKRRGFTLIELMIVIAIISILMLIITPNMVRSRNVAKYSSCKSNLRSLAAAMESYAVDNNGCYPESLSGLQPSYIQVLPGCPVTGKADDYIAGYEVVRKPANAYTIICSGNNHASAGMPPGFPQYSATQGLVIEHR